MDKKTLLLIYNRLHKAFGPRHWWPADTPFEVMVGAILTQNTAWSNVEKAIFNLKKARLLSPRGILKAKTARLASCIRSSGFFNMKAGRLKSFVRFLAGSSGGDLKKLSARDTGTLRRDLLAVDGIGPETADSILLYALNKPVFVVDAYTKRFLERHGFIDGNARYDDVQKLFADNLPNKSSLFNEYHALIVELGKRFCRRRKPLCGACPLKGVGRRAVSP